MDDSIKHIISKFKYNAYTGGSKNVHDTIPQWEKYLGVTIHNNNPENDYYFVEMPKIEKITECLGLLKEDEKILTDCRFFALFVGCLLKKENLFQMIKTSMPEVIVPDNCHYMTLDLKYFILNKQSDNPTILSRVLGDLNGQWLVKLPNVYKNNESDQSYYLGIVDDGALHMNMTDWMTHYKKNVEDRLKELHAKQDRRQLSITETALLGMLNIYIKKHNLQINIYKKCENDNCMNVNLL